MLLAIDTATSAVTVAAVDGGVVLAEDTTLDQRRHGELLAPAVARVAEEIGGLDRITRIVVGVGPGPFTGLRVGVVTALTLGHARGLPVVGVSSLDALAYGATQDHPNEEDHEFVVATDAKRKEVFWARYARRDGALERLDDPAVARAAALPDEVRALPCAGRGPQLYPQDLAHASGPLDVSAAALGLLAEELLDNDSPWLREPRPWYLRRPDAMAPGPPKSVRGAGGAW